MLEKTGEMIMAGSGEDFFLCLVWRPLFSCFSKDGSYFFDSSLIDILDWASPLEIVEGMRLYIPFHLGASGAV